MTPAEILRAARALIDEPERWRGPDVKHCPCTAINSTSLATVDGAAARRFMCKAVGVSAKARWLLWHWNDAPERTHAEVMAAFDRAIEMAEGK